MRIKTIKKYTASFIILLFVLFIVEGFFPLSCAAAVPGIVPQTLNRITDVSSPGIVQQRLGAKIRPYQQSAAPNLVQPTEKKPETPEQKIKLKLTRVIIKGNTTYTNEQLQTIFASSLNKTISLADLQNMVQEITKKYRSAGYVLSRAILPPQVITNGVVTVQVIEGFISDVKLEGNFGITKAYLTKYTKHLTRIRPFQISYLERDMLLINDMSGLSVKAVIQPSKTVPGGADLLLFVDRTHGQAFVSYDNFGTRFIGPQEVTVSGSLYSMMFPGDNNTLRYVTVPTSTELQLIEFLHSQPLGIHGLRTTIGGNYSATHPLFTLASSDVLGNSTYIFGDFSYPIVRTRSENIFLHSTLNYQNVNSTILGFPFYNDRLRSIVLGGSIDGTDRWKGVNSFGTDFEQGFDIMGADQHVRQSRLKGVPNFTKVSLNGSRIQWINSRLSFLGAFQAQYSCNPLLATEQYAYGGSDFGRGYDPAAIVGDDGLAAKLEARWSMNPEWRWLQALQPYLFYDAGMIWNRDAINLPAKQHANSTGLGIRFNFMPQVTGNFFIAKPLTFPVQTQVAMGESGYLWRTFFQITVSFEK